MEQEPKRTPLQFHVWWRRRKFSKQISIRAAAKEAFKAGIEHAAQQEGFYNGVIDGWNARHSHPDCTYPRCTCFVDCIHTQG